MSFEEESKNILIDDPGNARFVDYAEFLRKEGRLDEALLISLKGVSANPTLTKGRLILARVFYELGFHAFAAREIRELLATMPENGTLKRLLELLSPGEGDFEESVVAESDFDIDLLDAATKDPEN